MANCTLIAAPSVTGERVSYEFCRLVADSYRPRDGDVHGSAQRAHPYLAGAADDDWGTLCIRLAPWLGRHHAEPLRISPRGVASGHSFLARRHGNGRSKVVRCYWRVD